MDSAHNLVYTTTLRIIIINIQTATVRVVTVFQLYLLSAINLISISNEWLSNQFLACINNKMIQSWICRRANWAIWHHTDCICVWYIYAKILWIFECIVSSSNLACMNMIRKLKWILIAGNHGEMMQESYDFKPFLNHISIAPSGDVAINNFNLASP